MIAGHQKDPDASLAQAAHAVGEGAKEVTTKIGHTSRDAVTAVKEKVSE